MEREPRGRKRLQQAGETWACLQSDPLPEDRARRRYGILRDNGGEVVKLELHQSKLIGMLPHPLWSMGAIRVLSLFGNELTGCLPEDMGQLLCLQHLDLSHNQLSGALPMSIGGLTRLRRLHLEHNQLSGQLPSVLSNLMELQIFTAHNNYLTGPLPDFSSNTKLQELELHENYLDGEVPQQWPKSVTRLILARNCLTQASEAVEKLQSTCKFPTTPRSGMRLPCQLMPQRTQEEIDTFYGALAEQPGYYDELGNWIPYDYSSYYQGYWGEAGNWIDTSDSTALNYVQPAATTSAV